MIRLKYTGMKNAKYSSLVDPSFRSQILHGGMIAHEEAEQNEYI